MDIEQSQEEVATERLTWQELKDFCNKLPAEEMANPVRWWGIDQGGIAHSVAGLTEDHLNTEDGWIAESDAQGMEPEDISKMLERGILPKGTPIIHVEG